jgi:hypothetical protein
MTMADFPDVFDIVLSLAARGAPHADDPLNIATLDKGDVVKSMGPRGKCDQPQFLIVETLVDPHQRRIPIKFARHRQGHAMLGLVGSVLVRVELDPH